MAINPQKPLTVADLPGGHYRWTRNPDSTYNILRVPIMTSLHANEFPSPTNEKPVDAKWLQAAIDRAALRESEGHFGAVHVNHHGTGAPDIYAGKLQLWEVGETEYNGEKRHCLYANFLRVPEIIFNKIRAGELSYRSIEGISWENPEIVSLALMPTETPFWRLPMLSLGEEASQFDIVATLSPRLAASLGERQMAEVTKIETVVEPVVTAALPTPPPAPPEKKEKVEVKAGDAPGGMPTAPGESTAPGGTEENLEQHVKAFIKGCSKYIKSELVDVEKPEEKKPAEQIAEKVEEKVSGSDKVELAAKQAKIDGLEAQLAQKAREEAVNTLVAQAEKSLAGFRITDSIRASMREFAILGDKPLGRYVEVVRTSLPQAAPSDPEHTTVPIIAVLPGENDIMASIQDQSPDIQARAKQWLDMGRRFYSDSGVKTTSHASLKEYVLLNLRREGVSV